MQRDIWGCENKVQIIGLIKSGTGVKKITKNWGQVVARKNKATCPLKNCC